MDRQELIKSVYVAACAIHGQWGSIQGAQGGVTVLNGSVTVTSTPGHDHLVIRKWNDGTIHCDATIDQLVRAERNVAHLVLYLASQDFLGKVRSSIGRLKAITRALS